MNTHIRYFLPLALLCPFLCSESVSQPARTALGNPPPSVFESPDRDEWQRPEWVIDQLNLKPTDIVADIGAGSGFFSRPFARRLTQGKVIAVDVDPEMLSFLGKKAAESGITNIESRLIKPDDTPLEPNSVDLIFLSNTLHHISSREAYYPQLIRALKPGGRIANIDFYKRDLPVGPQDLDHKLAKQDVLSEFQRANLFVSRDLTGLPHQYFLIATPLPPIPNGLMFDARTVTAGRPSTEQLGRLAELGFKTVLSLQTEAEGSVAEGTIVEALGMVYVNVPITSHDIRPDQIAKFSETLTKSDNYPMLIHCQSSNRVGGLILLHEVLNQNIELASALEAARRAGLKPSLERPLLQRITAERE